MRVAPIDHHWWYDRRLTTYDPGSVGHTQVDWSKEPHALGGVVSLVIDSAIGTCNISDVQVH